MSARRTGASAPIVLGAGLALFVSALIYLVVSSLARKSAPEFDPTPVGRTRVARAKMDHRMSEDTLTIDARDERAWRFASFRDGTVLAPADTSDWDVAARRHHLIARDAMADLGSVPFASVTRAPREGFVTNVMARDTSNAVTRHWYRYGMMSHLLEPNGHVFAARTLGGSYFKFEVLSYYCRGLEAGCLTLHVAPIAPPAP